MLKIFIFSLVLFGCSTGNDSNKRNPSSNYVQTDPEYDSPWVDWVDQNGLKATLSLSKIRKRLLSNNLYDPYISYGMYMVRDVKCDDSKRYYRSADGTCTNWDKPLTGASNVAFGRNMPAELITDEKAAGTLMSPDPSVVSKAFFTRESKGSSYEEVPFLNMLAASWIQFMNHDWITHGKNLKKDSKNPNSAPFQLENGYEVEKTQVDKTDKAAYKKEFHKTTLNKVTHWWDGSQIYGSNRGEQLRLRVSPSDSANRQTSNLEKLKLGKMTVKKNNIGNNLLPFRKDFNAKNNRQNQGRALTGFMDNWWVGLSMLHHLFVNEHNHIVTELTKKYVRWNPEYKKWQWSDKGWDEQKSWWRKTLKPKVSLNLMSSEELDEHLFQLGRLINSAIMAKIHTVEWTPAILSSKLLNFGMHANWYGGLNPKALSANSRKISFKHKSSYSGWGSIINKTKWMVPRFGKYANEANGIVGGETDDYGVPYSLTEEFTSVYRLHSLLPENLILKKVKKSNGSIVGVSSQKSVKFDDVRNEKSYNFLNKYKMGELFYSFGTQKPGQLILNNFPRFMQNLEIPGVGLMDLGAVDILRDRERGVPRYNQFRRAIGLKEIKKYEDFFAGGIAKTQKQKDILKKFQTVYGYTEDGKDNVELIDVLVGTLAEEVRPPGFGFGETPFQIFIVMASRRLMADRFFTVDYNERVYTKLGIEYIDQQGSMHQIIARQMPELAEKMEGLKSAFAPWSE